jgi:hypothetical protein
MARTQARFITVKPAEGVDAGELATALLLQGILYDMTPCLVSEDGQEPFIATVLELFKPWQQPVVLLVEGLRRNIDAPGWQVVRVDYALPDLSRSLELWQHFSPGDELPLSLLASKYVLTPGKIEAALNSATMLAKMQDVPLDAAMIDRAVLEGNTGNLAKIADRINAVYTWDDLVLDDNALGRLHDVVNRVRLRSIVEGQWGYLKKSAYGNGISVLFYGPAGTGKTMSAQVIANALGLPLYRINLAQIISKYIGETAKNLDAVFAEARSSNVILFFDEADALFAKRTDVKDSNDRHANSESAYLLQKVEEYPGVSILATNLMHNFDEAFRRRINYMVNIGMPSPEQRLRLWQQMVPPGAPLAEGVDLQTLARELEFSGSVIKSASVQAAFYAADENGAAGQVEMRHYIRAVRLELQKLGKSEPHFLAAWQ